MKCPHCLTEFFEKEERLLLGEDVDGGWAVFKYVCPACRRFILGLASCIIGRQTRGPMYISDIESVSLFRPKGTMRPPPPPEVPKQFAEDYVEACLVLPDSAKASAALSRRCLQNILRDVAKVKPGDLFDEIQEILNSGKLPSQIAEAIDAVRHIGNFAAHPIKSKTSGEIVPVETGEAEWNLDVLEALFDFHFVQPTLLTKKKDALNAKLKEAGKKPMK